MDEQGVYLLRVDVVAAGTALRTGPGAAEFRRIEELSLGDEIYDPIQDRLVEITEMACVTLDADTIRDRGFSPKKLGEDGAGLIYAVKVPKTLSRQGYVPPIRGEYALPEAMVFFALGFERKATVETAAHYCEFVRPSQYAIENITGRPNGMTRDAFLTSLGQ
jgi:hypothetical protein